METKICKKCNQTKEVEAFHKASNGKQGRRAMCSTCCNSIYYTEASKQRRNETRRKKRSCIEYREKENLYNREHNAKIPLKVLFRTAKNRAKQRGLEFSITLDDLQLPITCPLLHIPLQTNSKRMEDNSYSLDRIDNTKGYIKGNVWIISNKANRIKNDCSIEELEILLTNLKHHWAH